MNNAFNIERRSEYENLESRKTTVHGAVYHWISKGKRSSPDLPPDHVTEISASYNMQCVSVSADAWTERGSQFNRGEESHGSLWRWAKAASSVGKLTQTICIPTGRCWPTMLGMTPKLRCTASPKESPTYHGYHILGQSGETGTSDDVKKCRNWNVKKQKRYLLFDSVVLSWV